MVTRGLEFGDLTAVYQSPITNHASRVTPHKNAIIRSASSDLFMPRTLPELLNTASADAPALLATGKLQRIGLAGKPGLGE